MNAQRNPKAGLDALLTPDNCVLLLIDHQPFQFAGLRSHDSQTIINNVVGLARGAKLFGVPTLLTTVLEERGGYLIKQLQDVFPDQKPINRTFINAWEDARVIEWVKKTGRKKLRSAVLAEGPRQAGGHRVLFMSADDMAARAQVSVLFEQVGFATVDLGGLATGGKMQQFPGGPLSVLNLLRVD
jgi:nicotinamidase-related amidase